MRKFLVALALIFIAVCIHAQTTQQTVPTLNYLNSHFVQGTPITVSQLGAASLSPNQFRVVTDAQTNTDCSVGGGSTRTVCSSNGTVWSATLTGPQGPAGSGGYTGVTSDGANGLNVAGAIATKGLNGIVYVSPSGDTTCATDTTNIQAAITAAQTSGALVQLQTGSYYFNGPLSATALVNLNGAGKSLTRLYKCNATGDFFDLTWGGGQLNSESFGADWGNFALLMKSGVTPTAGDAFVLNGVSSSAYMSYLRIHDVSMWGLWGGFKTGSYLISNYVENNTCTFFQSGGDGCLYYNTPTPGGDFHFTGNEATGPGVGITIAQGDVLHFDNNKTNQSNVVFLGSGPTFNIFFDNNSFEGYSNSPACGIDFGTGTSPQGVTITGGELGHYASALCHRSNVTGLGGFYTDFYSNNTSNVVMVTGLGFSASNYAVTGGSGNITIDASVSQYQTVTITGAVSLQNVSGYINGQTFTLQLCQGSTPYAVTATGGWYGFQAPPLIGSTCTQQIFYSYGGGMYALTPAIDRSGNNASLTAYAISASNPDTAGTGAASITVSDNNVQGVFQVFGPSFSVDATLQSRLGFGGNNSNAHGTTVFGTSSTSSGSTATIDFRPGGFSGSARTLILDKNQIEQLVISNLLSQSAIASATTIAPTGQAFHVTGTTAIATITAPTACTTSGQMCQLTLVPDGLWTTTTGGNIALASTAVVSKALIMTYDPATTKWYPSY